MEACGGRRRKTAPDGAAVWGWSRVSAALRGESRDVSIGGPAFSDADAEMDGGYGGVAHNRAGGSFDPLSLCAPVGG